MDRRTRKTTQAIKNAFMSLLAERDYQEITVIEIANRADISRSTFYDYYETKDFLLEQLSDDLFQHVFDVPSSTVSSEELVTHLFRHFLTNQSQLKTILLSEIPDFENRFKQKVGQILYRRLEEQGQSAHRPNSASYHREMVESLFLETLKWGARHREISAPDLSKEILRLLGFVAKS